MNRAAEEDLLLSYSDIHPNICQVPVPAALLGHSDGKYFFLYIHFYFFKEVYKS